jgi:glycosyltransferase involved in cell wall biosynthesis
MPLLTEIPFVSVLMTVFNRAEYLRAAVKSVLSSTYRNFELIISDDCSTDGSQEIATRYAAHDSRVRVHVNSKNLGDYGNRMQAASLASGEYLKYVDSDDMIYPHSLEVMVRHMLAHPTAAIALSHSLPELPQPYPVLLSPSEVYRQQFLGRGCLGCGPGGAIIRTSAFRELGGFRPEWGVLSDMEYWLRASAKFPVVVQQPALIWWRTHPGQEYRSGQAETVYLMRGFELEMTALNSSNCPLDTRERINAVARIRNRHARRLISMAIRRRRVLLAAQAWRGAKLSLRDLLKGHGVQSS